MSYNLVDPVTGDLTQVAGRNAIDDGSVSETSVWSSQKTSSKIAEKVGKTDIATTIDGKSTDTQVPSAKAVWNKSKNKIQRLLDGVDIIVYADSISNEMVTDTVRIMNATNSPYGVDNVSNDFYYTIYNINDDRYKRILAYNIRKNDMYMIIKNNNIWGTWQQLATESDLNSKGVFKGYIEPNKKLTINMESYGEVYGYVQVKGSASTPFRLHNAVLNATPTVFLKRSVTINEENVYVDKSFGTTASIGSVTIANTNGVWTITNTSTETESYWIGGGVNSVTLSDA